MWVLGSDWCGEDDDDEEEEEEEEGEGEIKYARPKRPVNPFEMICEERQRSAAQEAQRRRDVCPDRYGSSSAWGLVLFVVFVVVVIVDAGVIVAPPPLGIIVLSGEEDEGGGVED